MKNCPECNSDNIIVDAKALDRGDYNVNGGFKVAIDESPDAFMFKQTAYSEVNLKICGECGYIRFYAKDLQTLKNANDNRQK